MGARRVIKAGHDLDTAHQISGLPAGHLDTAIYHCQRAAKGFLAYGPRGAGP